jgi:tetratricopeptide (TPR) repeat protein
MNAEEIHARLAAYLPLPAGRAKSQRLEPLAAQAKEAGDPRLEAEVLIALSGSYENSAERERLPVLFGRLLQLLDRFPAELGTLTWKIHWQLKWMTLGLVRNPAVPLETIYRWLDELDSRYRQRGYSLRPVHALRGQLAHNRGDDATASAEMEASIAAPRDRMADCEACERNDWGTWRAALGDDAGALKYWTPLLDGTRRCQEEPHRVLAKALLPLLRTGRTDDARGAYLRGYPLVRQHISLRACVGEHIEFCALTGNEARGLEILAEHTAWLTDADVDTVQRLSFAAGACVLLRRLTVLGHGALPAGTGSVDSTLPDLEREIRELCGRYDARNGNTAVSDRMAQRLAQQPLLDRLPLGFPARLPRPPAPAPSPVPDAPADTLDELIAEARRLADARHPDTAKTWAKVAATGRELPAEVAARVARSRAGLLLGSDPEAAHRALLDAARQFGEVGDQARACEARTSAAVAQALAGDPTTARETAALAIADAQTAFGDGRFTPRQYLAVRAAAPMIVLNSLGAREQRTPGDITDAAELIGSELATAERLGEPHHAATLHEMLGQLWSWRDDQDKVRTHLTAAVALYLQAGEPWRAASAEAVLGQLALRSRDPQTAERYARQALDHGGGLLAPDQAAQLNSVLAEAIGAQEDRQPEFIDASLAAALAWEELSEPDALHNTFNAARAYARLGRHGEAAALFAEVMPRVHIPYEPTVIAMTREQYAQSLARLGRHREAAAQFLEAATLIQQDPRNVAAHARLARSAADALRRSGQRAEALAAYQRAADLFRELGDTVDRVRSLRSAAWLQFGNRAGTPAGPDAQQAAIAAMRAILTELESLAASNPAEDLAGEIAATRTQLDEMLAPPDPDEPGG